MPFNRNKHAGSASSGTTSDAPEDRPEPEGDYEYHPRLYMSTGPVVEFEVGEMRVLDSDWGQTIVLYMDNVEVVEGAVYDRDQSDEDSPRYDKFKLFALEDIGYDPEELESGEVDPSQIPDRHTENYFGDPYRFYYQGVRIASEDGEDSTVEYDHVDPDGSSFDHGTTRMHFGTTSSEDRSGPTAQSKRMVRLLAEDGAEALRDVDSDTGWVASDVQTAEEIVGRRVRMWMTREEYNDNPWTKVNIEDAETGNELPTRGNDAYSDSSDSDDSSEDSNDSSGDGSAPWDEDESDEEQSAESDMDSEFIRDQYSDGLVDALEWADSAESCEEPEDVIEALEKTKNSPNAYPEDLSDDEKQKLAEFVAAGNFQ